MATIGILNERTVRQHETVAEQLQAALNGRILIERAKGIIAERHRIFVADAFTAIRAHARHEHRKPNYGAGNVVDDGLDVAVDRGRSAQPRHGDMTSLLPLTLDSATSPA